MAVARTTGAKAKCDKLFSRLIRFQGFCENCDYRCPWECEPQNGVHRQGCKLQCAHIVTRHISSTRCDPRNAFALCAKCHHHFTLWPIEFARFTLAKIGDEVYDDLRQRAQQRSAPTNWSKEYEKLTEGWDSLRSDWGLARNARAHD